MSDDPILKSLEFARDTSKDLITLATGTITLSVTFLKDVYKDVRPTGYALLLASWLAYLVSILFGITTLLNVIGNTAIAGGATAGHTAVPARTFSPYEDNVRYPAMFQIFFFVAGTGLLIGFGAFARFTTRPRNTPKSPPVVHV